VATIEQRRAAVRKALRDPAFQNASARSIAMALGVSVGLVLKIRAASGAHPLSVICFNGRKMKVGKIGRRSRRRVSFSIGREVAEEMARHPAVDFTGAVQRAIEKVLSRVAS
jgi:hypothetical protein